uniref:Putative phosphatidylinositol transfer protein pdr16 n=1 Tax=Corethrella appendiculata TaxID=1370023 RepID=U5EYC4_9DIPT
MVLAEVMQPSDEQIKQLRDLFDQKLQTDAHKIPTGGFNQIELDRIYKNDEWLRRFLQQTDLDIKESLKMLWDTCEWRKTNGTNDINENTVRMDYLEEGVIFPNGYDLDGKPIIIFKAKLYVKSGKNMDDMKRMFVYWVERIIRESNGDLFTLMFDMSESGFSNIDMEFVKYIIDTLKYYYPVQINYLLIQDMPWILNATFQIIKKLLPAKAVARLKFTSSKNISEYVDEKNALISWGGKNDYVFKFESENSKTLNNNNNNIESMNNNNVKKVHFANFNASDSPMIEAISDNNIDGEMLRVIPNNCINFIKSGNELIGNVEIINIDTVPVTYKIKTTVPEKCRVRPSIGVLSPNVSININVVLQQESNQQFTALNREKFLVMCMRLGVDASTSSQDLAELWKNTSLGSNLVEQHRLKCALPANYSNDSLSKNGTPYLNASSGMIGGDLSNPVPNFGGADRNLTQFQTTVTRLNDTIQRLETRIKFNQTLQWITIAIFLLISIAMIYILKLEINNNNSQYCLTDKID